MTIPYLPGFGDEITRSLGPQSTFLQGMRQVFNPNYDVQQQLKMALAKDPSLRQKLIDAESLNPGTLAGIFGKGMDVYGLGNPSSGAMEELFARNNLSKPTEMLAQQQTPQAEKLLKQTTGTNSSEREFYKYRNIVNKEEAETAPIKSALDRATATMDLHLLPQRAQEEAAKLSDETTQRKLVNGLLTHYKGPAGVVNALINKDENMPEEARNAAFKDEGIWRQYNEAQQDKRLELQGKKDETKNQIEKDSIQDRIDLNDAENKSNLAAKYGNNIKTKDLFLIKKYGLESDIERISGMTAEQIQAEAQKNPSVKEIIDHPTLISSWHGWEKTQQDLNDKDIKDQRGEYNKAINLLRSDILSAKRSDPEINNRIIDIMSLPYYNTMQAKGTPLPIIKWDKNYWISKHDLMFQYPNGKEIKSGDIPMKPDLQSNDIKAKKFDEIKKRFPFLPTDSIVAMIESGRTRP